MTQLTQLAVSINASLQQLPGAIVYHIDHDKLAGQMSEVDCLL